MIKHYNTFKLNKTRLINNAQQIKNHVGQNVLLCAMVKADAYGHGMQNVCNILQNQVDCFGVATVNEAKKVREVASFTPILVVGVSAPSHVIWAMQNNASLTVSSFAEVKAYKQKIDEYNKKNKLSLHNSGNKLAANERGDKPDFKESDSKPVYADNKSKINLENNICELSVDSSGSNKLKLHFKINTGLNRIGFNNKKEFLKAIKFCKKHSCFELEGVYTHFATKANDEQFITMQFNEFEEHIKDVKNEFKIVHCCNSYATEKFPQYHCNMVRCGFLLYGWTDSSINCLPVSEITAKILHKHKVLKGHTIGYERSFIATKGMTVAVVSMGYGDGFDRRLSNVASVYVNNALVPVVGYVCMDVFMVDISNVNNAEVGDEVLILGEKENIKLSPQYYANILQTSPYEVLLKFNHKRMEVVVTE